MIPRYTLAVQPYLLFHPDIHLRQVRVLDPGLDLGVVVEEERGVVGNPARGWGGADSWEGAVRERPLQFGRYGWRGQV